MLSLRFAIALMLLFSNQILDADMITREQLEEMFTNIEAKTPWNLKDNMLWGYFFTSKSQGSLNPISKTLEDQGYKIVGIRKDDNDTWWLHVEKIETHSVDSLSLRNHFFYNLAQKYDVTYDGMDVGPTP